jgi:H+/Cl- antiporter ClcA
MVVLMMLSLTLDLTNLFLLIVLWLFVVATALWMVDRLFPRIQRNRNDRTRRDA